MEHLKDDDGVELHFDPIVPRRVPKESEIAPAMDRAIEEISGDVSQHTHVLGADATTTEPVAKQPETHLGTVPTDLPEPTVGSPVELPETPQAIEE